MTKKQILDTLSVVEKNHIEEAIQQLNKDGIPGNRRSYLYDVIDPESGEKYPPPYLLETAYKIASGKKLPKGFFDKIKNNGPHFEKIQSLGYQIETKWYDDLDLSSKVFSYKWLYTLSTSQWNKVLDAGKMILDNLDLKKDDRKLVVSFRDDAKQRMGIIIGSKIVGGFYLEKGEIYLRFFVDENYDISVDSRLSLDDFKFANKIGKLIYLKLEDWQGENDPLNQQVLSDISNYYKDAPGTSWKSSHQSFMTDVIRSQGPRRRFLSFIRQNPQERLIDIYKFYLKTTGNKDELYKWEVGKQFKDNWDLEAKDFSAMLKSVKLANLISIQSNAFYRESRKNPEEARTFFTYLFDESKSISDRLDYARDQGTELVKKWHPGWKSAGQDERTLSVLWGYNDLSKHALYKSSFYSKYCDLLEVPVAKAGEKYEHYLTLINDLVENYIKKDQELITLHNKTIDPEKHIEDPNYHLLAQNLLYRILDGYWTWEIESEEECNYWIFQGNPKIYDTVSAIQNDHLESWWVHSHKSKVEKGDKIILWLTGANTGCYALAEVDSSLFKKAASDIDKKYYNIEPSVEPSDQVKIKIIHDLTSNPVLKTRIKQDPIFDKFKGGSQGTNFSATKEEYETLLEMIDETMTNYKQAFKVWLKKSNPESINMVSSYMRAMELLDGVLDYELYEESDIDRLKVLYDDLIENQNSKNHIYLAAGASSYGKHGYYSAAISKYISFHKEYNNTTPMEYKTNKFPLNQILYGPPGTGKTYVTINKSLEIIDEEFYKENKDNREKLVERFDELKSLNQIVFTTFHQSMSYEEFIEGIKPATDDDGNISYEVQKGLFRKIVDRANSVSIIDQNFDETYQILLDSIKENGGKLVLETLKQSKEFTIYENSMGNLRFHSNSGKQYTSTIKKEYIKTYLETGEIKDWPSYITSVAQTMIDDLGYRKESRDSNKNYVLIIDEINRGNVSNIFGELITLIEDDKRIGQPNHLSLTLPYSQEKDFSIPHNLYIIGTMNTADRSVEALDTALRRRFTFEERMPEPELLKNEKIGEIDLTKLLTKINERIETLIDRDHTIGHAYLMGVKSKADLKNAFENKIIPLLQEYFYGDYGKIGLVLGEGFVKVDLKEDNIFSSFDYEGRESLTHTSYTLKSFDDKDFNFEDAIQQLFN